MTVIDGTYELKIQTPMGEKYATLILQKSDNQLSGSFITKNDNSPVKGTCTANNIDFETEVPTPIGKITARIIGAIDGDTLIAESKLMFAKATITGTRKP